MSAHLVLLGPPGAGKGTQAVRLSAQLRIPAISTGDIFRANVAGRTELGLAAQRFMDAGEYVPDDVTNAMVRDRLARPDAREGFVLDGYPRTLEQVTELDAILADQDRGLDAVVELVANHDEVVARMLRRATIEGRPDDTDVVIRRRLEVYAEQTEPLTRVYGDRGLLVQVDGTGTIDEVTERMLAALAD
jgi:adenylate kinase